MSLASQSPFSDDRGELVIRPSWAFLARWERHIAWLFLLGIVFVVVRIVGRHQTVAGLATALAFVALWLCCYAVYIAAYMRGTRLTVSADGVLVTHWFRSTATVPTREIARVVRCSMTDEGVARRTLFVLSPTGRCVISLHAERWNESDLDRIWRYLRITPEGSWDDPVSDIRRRFPGAF